MKGNDIFLVNLVDKKIKELEHFIEITSQMLNVGVENMDKDMEALLDERDKIVGSSKEISNEILRYTGEQTDDRQAKIKAIFRLEKAEGLTGELLMLQNKVERQEELMNAAKEIDKKAFERMETMRKDLLSEMTEMSKTKQVADYFSSHAATDLIKGGKLNVSN